MQNELNKTSSSSSTASNSSHSNSQKKCFKSFKNMIKKLDFDCDDVDFPEDETQKERLNQDNIDELNNRNKSSVLENPFLTDFFLRLRKKYHSKNIWFNNSKP